MTSTSLTQGGSLFEKLSRGHTVHFPTEVWAQLLNFFLGGGERVLGGYTLSPKTYFILTSSRIATANNKYCRI